MKDRYEISLWEDFPDVMSVPEERSIIPFLNERKLCVIGSDSMFTGARAIEPKMIENVNGTHKFSFKMYYNYIDEFTGETYQNPFLPYLVNERKIKVLWKDSWYDLLIKDIQEDSNGKSAVYICEDLFITELSKNGYNLEFSSDLQNNIGTAADLAEQVLECSGWYFDREHSTTVLQKTEEPVYEAILNRGINVVECLEGTQVTIPSGKMILVFYSQINKYFDAPLNTQYQNQEIQFVYADEYTTDNGDMLVTNGNCYTGTFTIARTELGALTLAQAAPVASIIFSDGTSTQYRANRLVNTQLTEYDKLLDRYVNVYSDTESSPVGKKVYGYQTTEFSDPLSVVNLIVNPSGFTGLEGWFCQEELTYQVYPKFDSNTQISSYNGKSYLRIPTNEYVYNSAIISNKQYFTPTQNDIKKGNLYGFQVGDKYIIRAKFLLDNNNAPGNRINSIDSIYATVAFTNLSSYEPVTRYFYMEDKFFNGDWLEIVLRCTVPCTSADLEDCKLLLYQATGNYLWIEEVQFFKYAEGVTSYEPGAQRQRINPGEMDLQGVETLVYRYYNADHDGVTDVNSLHFLYQGEQPSNRFEPVMNNYEKLATIEAKNSNRFNILQSIAEKFQCWIRFEIAHDATGRMEFDNIGLPIKTVRLVDSIGSDLGWSFEYGIDLKTIQRKIVSNNLTTKVIVLPNDNEFGRNGFCTIARSKLNYPKENFILNFDYFTNQGLLDAQIVTRDLYSTSDNYIGYYYLLNKYNTEYDELTDLLLQKQIELTKYKSEYEVYSKRQIALIEQEENCKAELMALACVDDWDDAEDYVQSHADNTKVQSLMNAIAQLGNEISTNINRINSLYNSISSIESFINTKTARQETLRNHVSILHDAFFQKYARYIQEGTWQDKDYSDDDKYYLDALDVAYTSSRPQLQYQINVARLSSLEDFSSKVFNVGDICYIKDKEFFGYNEDGITPFKLKIAISEITSYFESPEKDVIKVQNYKTQFDDLFRRITATTQSLQYASGSYERAASVINTDRTLSFNLLQDTFDENENWVLNASNQQVTWDSTGITIIDETNSALKLRLMAGGIFITNDGGQTWKNAVRGDGISTNTLTAGRVNTSEIYLYDGAHPSFRWDSSGINAYDLTSNPNFGKYVRFDRFGIYGYSDPNDNGDFVPTVEDSIWTNSNTKFGLTWKGFFLRGSDSSGSSLEIKDDGTGVIFEVGKEVSGSGVRINTEGFVVYTPDQQTPLATINRVQIGKNSNNKYGIWIKDVNGNSIFSADSDGNNLIGGWAINNSSLSITNSNGSITINSSGSISATHGTNGWSLNEDGSCTFNYGTIGGWAISSASLAGGNVSIGSDGNLVCTVNNDIKWKLSNDGTAIFHNIFADTGTIAGWTISTNAISNGNTTLSAASQTPGRITTSSLYAYGGSIGGWTINNTQLKSNNDGIILNSSNSSITLSATNPKIYFGSAYLYGVGNVINIGGYFNINSGQFRFNNTSSVPVYSNSGGTGTLIGYAYFG